MHRVQQRQSRVLIYTNCEGDDVNLEGDEDGVEFSLTVALEQQDQSSPEEKRTIAFAAVSKNYIKIGVLPFFHDMEVS
jgi:hypothetical protein